MNPAFTQRKLLVKFSILALFSLLILLPQHVYAQATGGSILGRVTDESGAPLPGASVTALQTNTSQSRTVTTDSDGYYRIPEVRVGPYEITVTLSGFSTQVRKGVNILVGQQANIDFTLQVSGVTESIVVEEDAPIIEMTKNSIGATITNKQIDDLPLLDRDFVSLAMLAPGITFARTEATSISGSGSSGSSNTFLIDGLSNDQDALGDSRGDFSPDAIGEFEVLSSQYNAEYGQASGAIINVLTRSGTNDYHGRFSLFYRADGLAASNPFAEETPFDETIVGGSIGGPIIKDKTFFFASYEHDIRDDTAFVNLDPALLASLGLPTETTFDQPLRQPRFLVKVDHHPNAAHSLTGRFRIDNQKTENAFIGDDSGGSILTAETGVTQKEDNQDISVNHTWIPSENTLNEARFQFAEQDNDLTEVACPECPTIIRPSLISGKLPNFPQFFNEDRWQFLDSFSFNVNDRGGDHFFKTGVDFSHITLDAFVPQNFAGVFVFTTDAPFDPADPTTFPLFYQESSGNPDIDISNNVLGLYFQDQWMVNEYFTLNLGLRWEYEDHILIENDKNNFGPRLHFSWDPFKQGRTAIRGGYGRYFDQIMLNAPLLASIFEPDRFRTITLFAPGYPDPFSGGVPIGLPTDTSILVPGSTPVKDTASFGIQHELRQDLAFTADFVYAKGNNLLLLANTNQPINGVPPDPTIGLAITVLTEGHSEYKALQVGVEKRFSNRYSVQLAYTLADSKTNAHSHQSLVSNAYDLDYDYGSANDDVTHTLNAAGLVEIPWGIKLGASTNFTSAPPFNILSGFDTNMDTVIDRPPGVEYNAGRGEPLWTVNLRVSKVFDFGTARTEFLVEAFNLFNRSNVDGFVENMLSPNFGEPTTVVDEFRPRQVQLGFRVDF
jgi:outer membrane receptor for ferrienterochelin and colicin